MMSEADDTAKKVCDAMVAKDAKRAEYFQSRKVHKYRLKDTFRVGAAPQKLLSRHQQQSWYIPGAILWKNRQDVYVIQVGNNKTVEPDQTQLLPREPDPHGRAVTFKFRADAFDSDNDGEEDEYTADRILSEKPECSTPGRRQYKVRWKGSAALRDSWEPPSSFVPQYTSVWLNYLKAKKIKLDVKDVLVHLVMGDRDSGPAFYAIFVHLHICNSFVCRSDARTTARNLSSTTHPHFIDMRWAFGTKSSLGLCSYSFVVTIGHRLLREFPQNDGSQEPLIISYFLDGAFGKCIGGSDTPAIWDRLWTSRLEFQSLQGM